jgi:hypothetical protein
MSANDARSEWIIGHIWAAVAMVVSFQSIRRVFGSDEHGYDD